MELIFIWNMLAWLRGSSYKERQLKDDFLNVHAMCSSSSTQFLFFFTFSPFWFRSFFLTCFLLLRLLHILLHFFQSHSLALYSNLPPSHTLEISLPFNGTPPIIGSVPLFPTMKSSHDTSIMRNPFPPLQWDILGRYWVPPHAMQWMSGRGLAYLYLAKLPQLPISIYDMSTLF